MMVVAATVVAATVVAGVVAARLWQPRLLQPWLWQSHGCGSHMVVAALACCGCYYISRKRIFNCL